ncbi:MAG: hypothetical protein ACFFH0_11060, partial [Promethearchaeota archaeon]
MAAAPKVSPSPSNAVPFAYEFVKRMRSMEDVRFKPSVRQTQAIPLFLSARYFKNGSLTLDDFVDAAVRTTYPSDQDLARIIAEDIVLGREKQKVKTIKVKAEAAPAKASQDSRVQAVIDQILREQDLASKIDKDKVEAGYEYLQKLRSRKDKRLYKAARDYLTEGDIVLRGLTSNKELKQEASSELLEDLGNLSSRDIRNAKTLGVLDQVCESSNAAESMAGRALRGDNGIEQMFKRLADRDPATAARALRHMEDVRAGNRAQREAMDRILQDSLRNLRDVADYTGHLERFPGKGGHHIESAPREFQLADSAEFAEKIKQHTKNDLMDDLLEQYDRQYDQGASSNVDFRQLAATGRNTDSWKSLLDKKAGDTIEDADSRSSPSEYLRHMIRSMSTLDSMIPSGGPRESWERARQKLADAAIARSPSKAALRKTVRELSRQRIVPSSEGIREAAEKLGMT